LDNSLFNELKRRNVFRVALAYLVIAWLIAQVSDLVLEAIAAPSWVMQTLLFLLGLGFLISLVISWAYEVTADGIKREVDITKDESITNLTAKKLDTITISAVVILIGLTAWQSLRTNSQQISDNTNSTIVKSNPTSSTGKVNLTDSNLSAQSIAVLPFVNRSSNKDDQFFVDGIQDDLLTKLAKIHGMKVISRTSVMEYRDTTKKIPQIAKELGVANILEGGVQRSGSHIRINAQLIHAATDEHLWAETYDKELNVDNVFSIQSEIAVAIAGAMKTTLTDSEKEQINKPLTDNLIAWEAYNKGLSNNETSTKAFKKARRLFEEAIALDPNFATAYAALAQHLMSMYWFDSNRLNLRSLAWENIQKSRAIDDNSAFLYSAEAAYYYFGFRDYNKALEATNKAITLSPNFAPAYEIKGYTLRRMGRFDESINALDMAASLNPRATYALQENAETIVSLRRYQETEQYIHKIINIRPENTSISFIKAILLVRRDSDIVQAIKELEANRNDNSSTAHFYWKLLAMSEQFDKALEFSFSSKQLVNSGYRYTSNNKLAGLTYFLMKDKDNAEKYLQLSIDELEKSLATDKHNKNYLLGLCQVHAAMSNIDQAHQYCADAIKNNNDAYDYPRDIYQVMQAYGMLGENDAVLKLMERLLGYKNHKSGNTMMLDPFLKDLHDLPKFKSLANQLNQ